MSYQINKLLESWEHTIGIGIRQQIRSKFTWMLIGREGEARIQKIEFFREFLDVSFHFGLIKPDVYLLDTWATDVLKNRNRNPCILKDP
jgi:hypothetical protein